MDRSKAKVDEPYRVIYETRWRGEADSFAIVPAEIEAVTWAQTRIVETTTRSEDDVFIVALTVEFIPYEAGEFEVPAFSVGYFDPALISAEESEDIRKTGPKLPDREMLQASAFMLTVRPSLGPYFLYGSILAVLVCLSALGVRNLRARRQRAIAAGAPAALPVPQTMRAALNLARQYRLDGKFYEFYKELARGVAMLAPSVAARKLREKIEADAKEVGYRGVRPTDDDMDGSVRDVERALRDETPNEE